MEYIKAITAFLLQLSFWQWIGLILLCGAFRPLKLVSMKSTSKSKTKLAKPATTAGGE